MGSRALQAGKSSSLLPSAAHFRNNTECRSAGNALLSPKASELIKNVPDPGPGPRFHHLCPGSLLLKCGLEVRPGAGLSLLNGPPSHLAETCTHALCHPPHLASHLPQGSFLMNVCLEGVCKSPYLGEVECKSKIHFASKRGSPGGPQQKEPKAESRKTREGLAGAGSEPWGGLGRGTVERA